MKQEFREVIALVNELKDILNRADRKRLERYLFDNPDLLKIIWNGGFFYDCNGKILKNGDYVRLIIDEQRGRYSERFRVEWNAENKRFLLRGPKGEAFPLNRFTKVVKI